MKSKEVFRIIFVNPFEKIAGWQALGLGLIFVVLSALTGSHNGAYFDGALDMHVSGVPYSLWMALAMLAIDLASLIAMFLIAGIIFSKNFRVIDVIGTNFLAKAPALLLCITAFMPLPDTFKDLKLLIENPDMIFASFPFIVLMLLTIPIMVWVIALLYNAFKVSLNIRKDIRVVVFIFVLIFAEVLSKVGMRFFL
jgi:hypothetical protein